MGIGSVKGLLGGILGSAACTVALLTGGCGGSNTPGRTEWIQPKTEAPRVGTVILLRGWDGVYSAGIDAMARQLKERGVTALVYMPEQYPEVATELVQRLKGVPDREPLCFVGHSRGVDSSLIISRELEKANIDVDVICCLDSVDEVTVPKNVKVCHNYWMTGLLGHDTNLLRGIPLVQAPGSTGKLYNYNLRGEYSNWKAITTDHVLMDDDEALQKRIIGNLLDVCVERSEWKPAAGRR